MRNSLPLRTPRLLLLCLTWALGVIGAAAGLNAIIKRNDQVADIRKAVSPLGITVNVDTNDLLRSGIVLAVGCLLLAIVTSFFIGLLVLDSLKPRGSIPFSTRTLGLQKASLAFLTLWVFACLIPVTKFAAERSAAVAAYTGGVQLPDSLVRSTESRLGFSRVYWDQLYVRLLTIAPWITFAFALVTTIVTFMAASEASSEAASAQVSGADKTETEMRENA
ncbi:hypothetical protein CTheo_3638 [Ceratobasidium theobromae]|uniref:Transmembrane protein n=1 Tax=Ceratobasidium theobromae TaxID=1582974 RepID=A0A5N5QNU0_9AGAM|nr:hypothetical protein CTheo_3638 [Ceratobasidium theobromae]